jgi:hypothetical protein
MFGQLVARSDPGSVCSCRGMGTAPVQREADFLKSSIIDAVTSVG